MPGPLQGYTVIEACQMVAGPLAGTQLADLGADVIKIETPLGGDRMRYLGTRKKDISAVWAMVNRGKRSVVVDLQKPEGVTLLKRLVAQADVFVQNFRNGVVERLGIDEPALRAVNQSLIYTSVSGFGSSGPYVDQKSYDYVIQALTGFAGVQADPETSMPALFRTIVVDKVTAYTATQGVMAALLARERGLAGGQHVRLSMIDAAIAFLWPDGMMQHLFTDSDGVTPGPHIAEGYVVRATKSGHIALMTLSERQFPGICRAIGREDLLNDERFNTLAARERNVEEVTGLIGDALALMDGTTAVDRLHSFDVPCALINVPGRVHLDPQVMHNEIVVEHVRPHVGAIREPRPALNMGATPLSFGRHAPRLDEHTDEVFRELGLTDAELTDLRGRGIIGRRSA